MKQSQEILKIKERIQIEIDRIYGICGAVMIIIPAETPCMRCGTPAHIIQEVQAMPVCGVCALEAREFGLQVDEI